MFVTHCSVGNTSYTADEAHQHAKSQANNAVHQLRSIAGLCNAASFDAETMSLPLEERRIFGDATDQASLRFSESFSPVADLRQAWKTLFELAFNSKNKFMAKTFTPTSAACDSCLSGPEADELQKSKGLYVSL